MELRFVKVVASLAAPLGRLGLPEARRRDHRPNPFIFNGLWRAQPSPTRSGAALRAGFREPTRTEHPFLSLPEATLGLPQNREN